MMVATAIPSMSQKHWILPSYGEISHPGNLVDIDRRNTACQTEPLVDESTLPLDKDRGLPSSATAGLKVVNQIPRREFFRCAI